MLWSSKCIAALFASTAAFSVQPGMGADICQSRDEQPLRFVDVFDGSPEELATLEPDRARERSGYWLLGTIYDAGRTVTIRCKYADGQAFDVTLSKRVNSCSYKINDRKILSICCK